MARRLFIDVETYSSVDIGKCGAYKYVESDDFEILLIGYAYDDEPVRVIDCLNEYVPDWLIEDMYDSSITKIAWNAAFERTCFTKYYGIYTEPEQWFDPMILSAYCGLPLSLAQAGDALGLGDDKAKLKTGKDLIRYFCSPCKPTKKNGQRTRNYPEHDPDKWNMFIEYNMRDVEVERTIFNHLKKWTPPYKEHRLWCLDQRINDRGMRIDTDLANKAIDMATRYKNGLLEQASDISGLDNPNSVSQVKQWLSEQEDVEVVSLNKKDVADLVSKMSSETAKKFMDLRSEFSQSSISKYDSAIRCTGKDEHIHGCFQFYGASTGRWCIAEGTPVFVRKDGKIRTIPIESVTSEYEVFDGDTWVHCDGSIFVGEKEVIAYDGVVATPDHVVYINMDEKMSISDAKREGKKIWKVIPNTKCTD